MEKTVTRLECYLDREYSVNYDRYSNDAKRYFPGDIEVSTDRQGRLPIYTLRTTTAKPGMYQQSIYSKSSTVFYLQGTRYLIEFICYLVP